MAPTHKPRNNTQPRDGLGWLLLAWVLLSAMLACEVQRGGQLVFTDTRLDALEACPEPICPACPEPAPSAGSTPVSAGAAPISAGAAPSAGAPLSPASPPAAKLDLNAASPQELEALPGVGPATAQRIVEQRQQRPFRAVRDLLRVKGIGPAKYRQLEPHVLVGPPRAAAP